jgi:uncharacterized protein YjbI with pentapeptide repeats
MPVEIVNETAFALGFVAGRVRKTGVHLTAIVKGAFKLAPGSPAVADAEKPLLSGDLYWDEDDAAGGVRYASDFAPFKPRADVVVSGTCHQPEGRPAGRAHVSVRLGSLRKSLAVFGPRHFVEQKLGGWTISEPAPFRSFPLRWEAAFGGAGFAANPVGRGFGDPTTREGRALPQIEAPSQLLKVPGERVVPAGLASLNRRWGLRTAKMGTYDPAWLAERWPDFPADFDWSYFNAAPADQQVDYLKGDEALVIEGMHPDVARYESWLPGLRPRCFLQKTGATSAAAEEVELVLDTVAIDMDAEELVLVWRGLSPVWSRDYAEVEKALLVAEALADEPLPASAYHDASKWRAPVTPASELAATEEAAAREGVAKAAPPPRADERSDDEEEIRQVEEMRGDLVEAGADQALLDRLKGVTKLAVFTAIVTAQIEKMAAEAPAPPASPGPPAPAAPTPAPPAPPASDDVPPPKTKAEAARRERARDEKAQVDQMRAELAESKPDPKLLEKLAPVVTTGAFLAILMDELPPPKTPAEIEERNKILESVRDVEARTRADELAEEAAERAQRGDRLTRAEVVAMMAAGASLAEANLTELDLTGLDLGKQNLAGAMLSGAHLERTVLAFADLTGASFRGAHLDGAVLDDAVAIGASFEGAKLTRIKARRTCWGQARLAAADLDAADLADGDFTDADLASATLSRASIGGALFDGANLERANLDGAVGPKAKFRAANLAHAHLAGAVLDGAVLAGSCLDDLDAAGASLRDVSIEGAEGRAASFVGCDLGNLRATGARLPAARFDDVKAEGARFTKCDLDGAQFARALLTGTDFTEASLVGATFQLARMQEATLCKAKLAGAKLVQANLFRARLGGADLTDADCRASNLFECDLFEADATRTRFERANVERTLLDRSSS